MKINIVKFGYSSSPRLYICYRNNEYWFNPFGGNTVEYSKMVRWRDISL